MGILHPPPCPSSKMLHFYIFPFICQRTPHSPLSVFTPQRYSLKTSKIFFKRINTFIFSFPYLLQIISFYVSFTHFLFYPLPSSRHYFHPPLFLILESFYPLVRKSPPYPKNCPHGGQARTIKIFHPFSITHSLLFLSPPAHYQAPFYPLFPLK